MDNKARMSVIDVLAWSRWADNILRGIRISNVYHLSSSNLLLFKLSGMEDYKFLVIQPGYRANLSSFIYPTPEKPDLIALSFRKYLRRQKIELVSQLGFDRELVFDFSNNYRLYVELLPRGEAVLVEPEGTIVHATGYKKMKDRSIKRGERYIPPPLFKEKPTYNRCNELLESSSLRALARNLGIPSEIISEAKWRSEGNEQKICDEIMEIIEESLKGKGYLVFREGKPFSYHPFEPRSLMAEEEYHVIMKEKFNDAIDEYYASIFSVTSYEEKSSNIREMILEKIREFEEKMKSTKELADFMFSQKDNLEKTRICVFDTIKKIGWSSVPKVCGGVEEISPNRGIVAVDMGGKKIWINVREPVMLQIQRLYEEAKKFKRKIESAKEKLSSLPEKRVEDRVQQASIRRKEWYERYHWSFTRNGFLVIAGKNASQNEAIVKKHMDNNDIFLHAEIHGAPATVLKCGSGNFPTEEDIWDAAVIAAVYSRGWREKIGALDVYWVKAEQVTKKAPSGQFLWKGGFMIYGEKNYLHGIPLMLTVGIERVENDSYRYIVGSEESVRARGNPIALLAPGETRPHEIGKQIIKIIRKRSTLIAPRIEELLQLLPGESRIIKTYL